MGLGALLAVTGCAHDSAQDAQGQSTMNAGGSAMATTNPSDDEAIVEFTHAQAGVLQPGQRVFDSPEAAAQALREAVDAKDRHALEALFGPEGKALIFSGDRVQENNTLEAASQRMHDYFHLDRPTADEAIVREGKENWPFPIPIVKAPQGWFFDVVAGRDELLNRRIGADELNAIAVAQAYVLAQKEYARKDRNGDGVLEYAQHFMSSPGQKNGLFWEAKPGEELSPMGPLVAEARAEGYPVTQPAEHKPHPFQGYFFHILKAQGPAAPGGRMSYVVDGKMTKGFALIARPSVYGASGIMTFMVGPDGKVYQKNLGPNTRFVANDITEFNPDQGWEPVKE
jgi:hypothetical protein